MAKQSSKEVSLLAELLALSIRLDPVLFQDVRHRIAVDPRTGALSKDLVESELEAELSRARLLGYPLGVLVLSVSSADEGDENDEWFLEERVLRAIVEQMKSLLRSSDWVAGHDDPNRFVIVLPGCGDEEIKIVKSKLKRGLEDYQVSLPGVEERKPRITIGSAVSTDGNSTVEELISNAEQKGFAA